MLHKILNVTETTARPLQKYRMVLIVSSVVGFLGTGCGEKKVAPTQAMAPVACFEEEEPTKKTTKKTTNAKSQKDEEEDEDADAETEEKSPKKTKKASKSSFALQSGTSTSTSTSTGGVNYTKDIKSFFVPNCVTGCHDSTAKIAPLLETWADISAGAKAAVASTKAGRMPIGTASLTEPQKKLLVDWETGGFLQGSPPATEGGTSTKTSTSTGTSVTKSPTKEPEEEVEEEEEEEEEEEDEPKTVKKAKTNIKQPENCVEPTKASSNTKKKAGSSTTKSSTKKAAADDDE